MRVDIIYDVVKSPKAGADLSGFRGGASPQSIIGCLGVYLGGGPGAKLPGS